MTKWPKVPASWIRVYLESTGIKTWRYLLNVIAAISFASFYSTAQNIHFNLVKGARDEGSGSVAQMSQDPQGSLWLATESGLYKYSGHDYTAYHFNPTNINSPAAAYIRCVVADRSGSIWLAPHLTGLDHLDPLTGIFTHFRHKPNDPGSLGNDTVWTLLQDHTGVLWVGTAGGLDRYDSATGKFIHYTSNPRDPTSLTYDIVRTLYEDKRGTLWVGTGTPYVDVNGNSDSHGGLNKFNRNSNNFQRYLHDKNNPNTLIDNRVLALFEDSRNNFWVGTAGDGLHTMDRSAGTFTRHLYDSTNPNNLSRTALKNYYPAVLEDHISFITEDFSRRIWIGTLENGINIFDPVAKTITYYGNGKNSKQVLRDKGFWMAYKTRDNVLWVSEYEFSPFLNLYKIKPNQDSLLHYSRPYIIFAAAEDDEHTLWFATSKGLIHQTGSGKDEVFFEQKDLVSSAGPVGFIEKDGSKFWVPTTHGLGLFDPRTKSTTWFNHQPGDTNSILSNTVLVKKSFDDQLWIVGQGATTGIDVMDTKTGRIKHLLSNFGSDTLAYDAVFTIDIDSSKHIWISSNRGLIRYDVKTGRLKKYLDHQFVYCMRVDNEGLLWAGAQAGLFLYDPGKDDFLPYNDKWGILSRPQDVMAIRADNQHSLWLSTIKGIVRLDKETGNCRMFSKNQGVIGSALSWSEFRRSNGNILVADTSGYFEIDPVILKQENSPPFVAISNFLLNNKLVLPAPQGILTQPLFETKEIRLNHRQNTFAFQFSAISFIGNDDDTRLLYMLQNYETEWHSAGSDKTAYYFNLPPGKYIFKIMALNSVGSISEKEISVVVSPPWWNTWWAYTLFGLLLAILVWTLAAYRSRRLLRANKLLEQKVQNRTEQLQNSLENLKAVQLQLVQSAKMASLGELTAGIAHEIQNPLNFVNNFAELNKELLQELKQEVTNGNLEEVQNLAGSVIDNSEKINYHGKRADSIVKGMLEHSRSSSGARTLADVNALADEYLRISSHGFRIKDKTFKVTLKTDFDTTIGMININPQDIGRLLLNLYNNAFYAVNERLKQERQEFEPTVTVHTKKIGTKVEIKVTDNGNGIPANIVEKIFQPFFTTKPTGQGTGLGLSLSYDIAKAHGGEISVKSEESRGSEFVVILPVEG